ncbi:hypothetical protein EHM69_10905 [candidate division KSB1 bacterium]|nr:MAG: hypothetical protein EHM69_10905 [candidate division KSB1 bacterium]
MKAVALVALFWAGCVLAQSMEDWVEASAQPEELQAWLDELRQRPLDLNGARLDELAGLPFFDERTANSLIKERDRRGYFASLDEVLLVESLNKSQREALREFAGIDVGERHKVHIRSVAGIARTSGREISPSDYWSSERADFYSGDHCTGYAFLKRKTGDADFARNAAAGIGFRSADETAEIFLGDYQYEAGTGLLFASSSGMANWVSSFDAPGPGKVRDFSLRPSSNRVSLCRGAAAALTRSSVRLSLLFSQSPRDAVSDSSGPIRLSEGQTPSSAELAQARRDRVREDLVGASGEVRRAKWRMGAAAAQLRFRPGLGSAEGEFDVPQFAGRKLKMGSVFGAMNLGGIDLLTEIAKSDPGGMAHQSAVAVGSKRAGISAYYLYAAEDFFSPHGNLWGGFAATPVNAQVSGVRIRSAWEKHSLYVNAALSRTPFRTESQPLRKYGGELNARWRTILFMPLETEVLLSRKWREDAADTEPVPAVGIDRARCDFAYTDLPTQYRIRLEVCSALRSYRSHRALGSLVFIQAKSRWRDWEGFGRLTMFHRETGDVSMPVFENALPGSYPLTTLGGSGSRIALMVSRKLSQTRLAVKVAHTRAESNATEFALEVSYGR